MSVTRTPRMSLYSIIPARIKYDNSITDFAKILFGELNVLANSTGRCWANDQFFMTAFNCSRRKVQKALADLRIKEYIEVFNSRSRHREIAVLCKVERSTTQNDANDCAPECVQNTITNNITNTTYSKGSIPASKLADISPTGLSQKQKQSLCNAYFDLVNASAEVRKANYGRVMKDIKTLAEMGKHDYDKVKQKLVSGKEHFCEKGLSWSTSAIIKNWDKIITIKKSDNLEDW